jgi:hypothetical protein
MNSNIDQVKRDIENSLKAKQKAIENTKDKFLKNVVRDAQVNLARNGSVARGDLMNSFRITKNMAYTVSQYAPFVEFGTKTKAKVPNDPQVAQIASRYKGKRRFGDLMEELIEWGKHKGILDLNSIFKIARSIAKQGTTARPFFYPSVFKNKHVLQKELKSALRERR